MWLNWFNSKVVQSCQKKKRKDSKRITTLKRESFILSLQLYSQALITFFISLLLILNILLLFALRLTAICKTFLQFLVCSFDFESLIISLFRTSSSIVSHFALFWKENFCLVIKIELKALLLRSLFLSVHLIWSLVLSLLK